MFNDTSFDHHHHLLQHSQSQQHQGSWCSPAHFTSHLFQQSSSGFQPGSFTSPSSFGTTSLARMESTFCKNFVCCSIPLDDLHDLLEHYEQAHCHQSSYPNASDSSSNSHRPDLVVFEDEDEWSGTESASTNLSNRPGLDRSRSPPANWPTNFSSKDSSKESRRKNQTDHWSKADDGFGIPPSLLDGQNPPNASSVDPIQFLMMIDGSEDGLSSIDSDQNADHQPNSDSGKRRRFASEQRHWEFSRDKPFKCPVPGCEKAYKQPNGLKYHQAHGHGSQKTMSVEDESKTFVCHDAVCAKRYKNINGLRYHYQHTGPHGAIGLQLLALGLHPSGPALNMTNINANIHPHRHPLLTSIGSSCTSASQDETSILASELGDIVMDGQ